MKLLTADKVTLGFIGLGNMGSRIAQRLLDHGYSVVTYDRDTAKAEAVVAERGFAAKNILELARTADVILSCCLLYTSLRICPTMSAGKKANDTPGNSFGSIRRSR